MKKLKVQRLDFKPRLRYRWPVTWPGRNWSGYILPGYLNQFSKEVLGNIGENRGLRNRGACVEDLELSRCIKKDVI